MSCPAPAVQGQTGCAQAWAALQLCSQCSHMKGVWQLLPEIWEALQGRPALQCHPRSQCWWNQGMSCPYSKGTALKLSLPCLLLQELEAEEYGRKGINLTPDLWLVKLMVRVAEVS